MARCFLKNKKKSMKKKNKTQINRAVYIEIIFIILVLGGLFLSSLNF